MDYRKLNTQGTDLVLRGVEHFDLADILECGQCFRWSRVEPGRYRGTVAGMVREITQQDDTLVFHGVTEAEFAAFWRGYFDFDRDYGAVKALLSEDAVMRAAVAYCPGMRVLRQPPWETLCSFIVSANNNIPRIRGIMERLSELFGEPVPGGFAFPAPERLARLSPEDLAPVRCGYRAAYIIDAAARVASGALVLEQLYDMPIDDARSTLMQVKGVGPKVAECALLYGFARAECVPVDVWIRRALETLYPGGLPTGILSLAGIGQQYLFHYVRNCPDALTLPLAT